jgi:hypothetical protein
MILLRVTNGKVTAGATFERTKDQDWRLVACAPILRWMQGLSMEQIKDELNRRNLNWQWLTP